MKNKGQTLEDWVHQWIDEILPNVIKNRTRQMYTETMGRHILPYIGDVKLTDLTSRKIEQWIETLKMQEESTQIHTQVHSAFISVLTLNSNGCEFI